jgi:hypothetical protein
LIGGGAKFHIQALSLSAGKTGTLLRVDQSLGAERSWHKSGDDRDSLKYNSDFKQSGAVSAFALNRTPVEGLRLKTLDLRTAVSARLRGA